MTKQAATTPFACAVKEAPWQAALTEVRAGSAKAVLALLTTKGVSAKERSQKAAEALHAAAASGQNGAIAALITSLKVPIDAPDDKGVTALQLAALFGHLSTARYLAKRGAGVNATCPYKRFTALTFAAGDGGIAMVRLLVEELGASLNPTAMHIAAETGRVDVIRYLAAADKAMVASWDAEGDSPLHLAVRNKQYEAVRVLVKECRCEC